MLRNVIIATRRKSTESYDVYYLYCVCYTPSVRIIMIYTIVKLFVYFAPFAADVNVNILYNICIYIARRIGY